MSGYRFNSFTGRLTESSYMLSLFPISARRLSRVDPPKIIWDTNKTKVAKTSFPSSARFSTLDPKVIAKQKHFQKNIEKPVYLMGGITDKILFGTTCVLVGGGVIYGISILIDLANR